MANIILFGPTGSGKSSLIKYFLNNNLLNLKNNFL